MIVGVAHFVSRESGGWNSQDTTRQIHTSSLKIHEYILCYITLALSLMISVESVFGPRIVIVLCITHWLCYRVVQAITPTLGIYSMVDSGWSHSNVVSSKILQVMLHVVYKSLDVPVCSGTAKIIAKPKHWIRLDVIGDMITSRERAKHCMENEQTNRQSCKV